MNPIRVGLDPRTQYVHPHPHPHSTRSKSAPISSRIAISLSAVEAEQRRRRWTRYPEIWAEERLGDRLWSGQVRILHSVRDHRKTAAPTCHGIGKSFGAAVCVAWWIDTHKPGEAFAVTTAPTGPQVKIILWKEIGRAHSRGALDGRMNQVEWKRDVADPHTGIVKEETVALGRKPSDYSPTAFQGMHAPFVLIVVDEANGVRGLLWNAIDSLMSNNDSKILEIGNPDDPTGEFYDHCKPGSGYNVVHISAFDSPNFTGERLPTTTLNQLIGRSYVEEKRLKWARDWVWDSANAKCVPGPGVDPHTANPFWYSKILGQFPDMSTAGSLIPLLWIRAAQERELPAVGPNELGLDVGASEDGDPTCCGHRIGPVFRVLYEERQPDTMKSCGKLLQYLHDSSIHATVAKVDYIGVGRGVVDRARELRESVQPIQVGEKGTRYSCRVCHHEWEADDPSECARCRSDNIFGIFANLLSQLWWDVRTRFEIGDIDLDPRDTDLAAELITLHWAPTSKGQIRVEYAKGPSPNRADALLFTFAPATSVDAGPYIPSGFVL